MFLHPSAAKPTHPKLKLIIIQIKYSVFPQRANLWLQVHFEECFIDTPLGVSTATQAPWPAKQLLCFCVCDVFGVGTSDTQRDAVYELTVMLCFSQHAPILQSVTGADVIADWLNQSAKACSEFTHVAGCAWQFSDLPMSKQFKLSLLFCVCGLCRCVG